MYSSAISCGSSPLARGTRRRRHGRHRHGRFIPAGAGNTAVRKRGTCDLTVHPRWRGEHQVGLDVGLGYRGSSPLARGTQEIAPGAFDGVRFIPAGAGNTAVWASSARARSVHPRWRGEHCPKNKGRTFNSGSSPLARGTRYFGAVVAVRCRFIPAGAGNT